MCPSVCPSVTSRSFIEMDERIELVFGTHATVGLILQRVFKIRVSPITRVSPCWNFVSNFGCRKFLPRNIVRRNCCELGLTDDRRQF